MNDQIETKERMLALKTAPLRQVQSVKQLLLNDDAKSQLSTVAAKHMNPERMMRVVANAIRTTPKLQNCEPMSFLGALMHCASMGLEPNTPLGHAYLIPFENKRKNVTEVQVIIGYKGFIDLARRSGQLASIHGDVVYDDDALWSHEYGSNQHLRHRPGPRKGKLIGAYCYVKLNLGEGVTAEGHRFMTMDEIIAHRDTHSQGWKTAVRFNKAKESPWHVENPAFEAMAIKTVVRALANRGELPMSIEFMEALNTDEAKADYRAFAMDPTGGVQIDGDEIEGEAVEHEQIEQEIKPEPKKDVARTTAPKSNPAADATLEAEARRVAVERERAAIKKQQEDEKAAHAKAMKEAEARLANQERERAAAEAQTQADLEAADRAQATEEDDPDFAEVEGNEPTIATDSASMNAYFDQILNDLLEDMPVEVLKVNHADKIAAIQAHDPTMYARLMKEIDAA